MFGRQASGWLYVVNADGSRKRELTSARYSTPTWSPDGRRIAFVRSHHVLVMNGDGSGEENLTEGTTGGVAPAWSPDGRRIAFLRGGDRSHYLEGWDVYVMNADGSGQQRLTRNAWLAAPAWSPDGRKLAFVGRRAGGTSTDLYGMDLYVMNADAAESGSSPGRGAPPRSGRPTAGSSPSFAVSTSTS